MLINKTKIRLDGELHLYKPDKVPREFVKLARLALRKINPELTMTDYLRARVHEFAAKEVAGNPHPMKSRIKASTINWKKFKFIKNPNNRGMMTIIYYPATDWELFDLNCAKLNKTPKYIICSFLYDLIKEARNGAKTERATTAN